MIRTFAAAVRKWVVPPSSGQHWDLLDGLRGIAILMVVAGHAIYANPTGPSWTQWISGFVQSGFLGVPVFFVLSGFLIGQPFFKARAESLHSWYVRGYATRRFLKVIPPFYLVIVLLATYYVWRYGDFRYVITGLQWAVGIPHVAYVPHPFNGSFWSLWVELGFYAVLPLLFLVLRGKTVMRTATIIAGCLLLVPMASRFWDLPGSDPEPLYHIYNRGRFPNSLTNFAWGVLFAGWYVANKHRLAAIRLATMAGYSGVLLLAGAMGLQGWWHIMGRNNEILTVELIIPMAGLATMLMLCFLFAPETVGTRILSGPALRYLGLISYEWFLIHQPALIEFRSWMGSAGGSMGRYLVTVFVPVLLSLLAAMAIYHCFSMPIIRRGRNWLEQTSASNAKTSRIIA